jgi:hypothetical protein
MKPFLTPKRNNSNQRKLQTRSYLKCYSTLLITNLTVITYFHLQLQTPVLQCFLINFRFSRWLYFLRHSCKLKRLVMIQVSRLAVCK